MRTTNLIPKISLALVGFVVLYFVVWAMPVRTVDPNSVGEHIDPTAVVVQVLLPLALFSVLFLGIWRACKASDYFWLVVQLLFFPSAYVYTLFINRGPGANNSFNPKPLRSSKMRH
jgi:hypothetical protein